VNKGRNKRQWPANDQEPERVAEVAVADVFAFVTALAVVVSQPTLIFENPCTTSIAVGGQNIPNWKAGGYTMAAGSTFTINTPVAWATGGTVWGCYPNNTKCNTQAPEPPVSVIELDASSNSVWYDVSYVSGANIPIGLKPSNSCPALTCPKLNPNGMPPEIVWDENGQLVGIWSVCKAAWDASRSSWFKTAWGANYSDWSQLVCCSGPYATKEACDPTSKWPKASNGMNYVDALDSQCDDAYSYPYDDQKSFATMCCSSIPLSLLSLVFVHC